MSRNPRIVYCCCCGKQVLPDRSVPSPYNSRVTTARGARSAMQPGTVFCGHCAEDLDDNGLFPEEAMQAGIAWVKGRANG